MYYLNINDDKLIKSICHAAFPSYNGKKVQINYNCKQINLSSYWSGGSRSYFKVIRLEDNKILNVPESHPVFNHITGIENFIIPENFIVVENIISSGKNLGLKIHTPSPSAMLESQTESLTRVQKMILAWIVQMNSAGRKDALTRYHFPKKVYDVICRELENMDFVKINKAGSVQATLKAKNYPLKNSRDDGYSWWAASYNWETKLFSNETKMILIEYKRKYFSN